MAGLQYLKMTLKNILNHDAHVKPWAQSIPYKGDWAGETWLLQLSKWRRRLRGPPGPPQQKDDLWIAQEVNPQKILQSHDWRRGWRHRRQPIDGLRRRGGDRLEPAYSYDAAGRELVARPQAGRPAEAERRGARVSRSHAAGRAASVSGSRHPREHGAHTK